MKQSNEQLLSLAIHVASMYHLNQFDKGGRPYILHALHVMNTVKSTDLEIKMIAVLHDVVEDTDLTLEDLFDMGFSPRVIQALSLLTKVKGQSYEDYLLALVTNRDAMVVKLADIRHNSCATRMKGLTAKDFERLEKYTRAYAFIKSELKRWGTQ